MDQGWATVVATVIALIGGTLLGGAIEGRRADGRIKADREWQLRQIKEQWKREDELASKARMRETRLRRLHATRDLILATSTGNSPEDFVAAVRDLDLDSIGDAALVEKYQAIAVMPSEKRAEGGGAALALELIRAVNKQEERILLQ